MKRKVRTIYVCETEIEYETEEELEDTIDYYNGETLDKLELLHDYAYLDECYYLDSEE